MNKNRSRDFGKLIALYNSKPKRKTKNVQISPLLEKKVFKCGRIIKINKN